MGWEQLSKRHFDAYKRDAVNVDGYEERRFVVEEVLNEFHDLKRRQVISSVEHCNRVLPKPCESDLFWNYLKKTIEEYSYNPL
jgi:hypothetical protein